MTKILHPSHKLGHYQSFMRLFKRKKMLVLGLTLLGFLSTALLLQKITPVYTAKAQLIFEGVDPSFVKTQQAILASNLKAQIVINKFKLTNDPAFNIKAKSLKKPSKFKTINVYDTKLSSLSGEIIAQEMEPIIARFRNNFMVNIDLNPYVIDLEYESYKPRIAAVILNEIINSYLGSLAPEVKPNNNEYELKNIENLEGNVVQAQININFLKEEIKNPKPDTKLIKGNELYGKAKIKLALAEAKLKPFLDKNGRAILNNRLSKSLTSPVIQKLNLRYTYLQQKLNALSIDLGSRHPKIIYLTSQMKDVRMQILGERQNIILRLKATRDQAFAQLKSLPLPALEKDNSFEHYNTVMHKKLDRMQEQLEIDRRVLDEYRLNYEVSLNEQQKIKLPVRILSQVSVSDIPSFPNKLRILSIGTIASFFLGIFIMLLIEKMRNVFLSARQLEEYLNLPCYALIPNAKKDKDRALSSYVVDNPSSETAEAVRALKLVIKLCADDENRDSKVIAITSSLPDEGKTTLSAWLAQIVAKSGGRAILIDADLRRPTIHKVFENKNTLSLVEYLSGKNKLEEVIDTGSASGLHIIYGRAVPNSALDLVSSDKMDKLICSLRKDYDLIIIDTPASMAVSDARAIAKISDQLLYAVLWNKTSRETVHNGISQFTQFKNAQVATVLTNIDLKKHVKMGYGEAINYYGSYK